jgi:hypothetical protein
VHVQALPYIYTPCIPTWSISSQQHHSALRALAPWQAAAAAALREAVSSMALVKSTSSAVARVREGLAVSLCWPANPAGTRRQHRPLYCRRNHSRKFPTSITGSQSPSCCLRNTRVQADRSVVIVPIWVWSQVISFDAVVIEFYRCQTPVSTSSYYHLFLWSIDLCISCLPWPNRL